MKLVLLLSSLVGCAYISDNSEKKRLDPDGDNILWPDDCDDNDKNIGKKTAWYIDSDQDGIGDDQQEPQLACQQPAGTAAEAGDCNDQDASIQQTITVYPDADGDGWGSGQTITLESCEPTTGYTLTSGDCNDQDALINPQAVEICDFIDNDCDQRIDDSDDDVQGQTWYADLDEDGFGDPLSVLGDNLCVAANGTTDNNDCNDNDASIHPNAVEICDHIDNNCDGFDVDVPLQQALQLQGAPEYVEITGSNVDLLNMEFQSFTLEAWIKTETLERSVIFSKYDPISGSGYYFEMLEDKLFIGLEVNSFDGNVFEYCFGETNLADNRWHHVAVSVRLGTKIILMVDGVLDQECPFSASSAFGFIENDESAYIGAYFSGQGMDDHFNGLIDDVKLWNEAASEQIIANNRCATNQQSNPSLVGWWNFESDSNDLSGNENHGQLMNGATLVPLP